VFPGLVEGERRPRWVRLNVLSSLNGEDAYADVRERYLRPRRAHLVALLRMATYSAGARAG
jgi:hypothetical protein